MITVGMNYEVLAGKEDQFESVFKSVLAIMNEMPGHAESHLYADVFSRNSYLIVSEWTDQEAFETFTHSEKFLKVTAWGREQILAGRPRHEIYGAGAVSSESDAGPGCPVAHAPNLD
ncbi:MAG: antibiotic biosynthesis monooxygenase [Candidatus Hydrogenedentes bacterium]|nr:antibiotic biosynthesis monooxygenase [Candidatus Hydrogenedentota bacterium]